MEIDRNIFIIPGFIGGLGIDYMLNERFILSSEYMINIMGFFRAGIKYRF
jgi:hypothetical protein